MLDGIDVVPIMYEDDLWRLAIIPRGKRKRRVGNTIIYESELVDEDTSIEHSKQTSTLDDCGQSFYPTSVIHSTSIKRRASILVSPGEGSKKRKGSGSAAVAELQVEDVITSSTHSRIIQTRPPAIHENNAHSSLAGRRSLAPHSDPTPIPQCTKSAEQRGPFTGPLASEPVAIPDTTSGGEAHCLTQEPDQPGRRRALLIAIQYKGQYWHESTAPMYLSGPYADAQDIRNLLVDQGYDAQDIQLMTDEPGTEPHNIPTHDNIKLALQRLVAGARRNDRFFLFFAGHGTQVKDKDGDEDDGQDEGIIPCDWATSFNHHEDGVIIDDYLRDTCVDPLPEGSQLIGVFDSCHAGTILDLPEQYPEREQLPADSSTQDDHQLSLQILGANGARLRVYGKIGARVICFAACTDSQRAYASGTGKNLRGRFTRAFTQGVRELQSEADGKRNPTVQELYDSIVEQLEDENNALKNIIQDPVLTTSFKKTAGDWQKPIEF